MEKTIQQRRKDFLEETVAFYQVDPQGRRALIPSKYGDQTPSECRYRTEDGRCCAMGRHIPDEKYRPDIEGHTVYNLIVQSMIPDEILALDDHFLREVQRLHDKNEYWSKDNTGLSEVGEKRKDWIIEKYCTESE